MISKRLYGHTSAETAYVVDDYPYSYRLRCQIRYWIEESARHGYRWVSQTTNPKKKPILVWNKPKPSTYSELAMCLYLDEQDHVQCERLGYYDEAQKVLEFLSNFPEADLHRLPPWIKAKIVYAGRLAAHEERSEADRQDSQKELEVWQQAERLLTTILAAKRGSP